MSARASVRFTRDVDLAVSVTDDAEAEGLLRALATHGYQVVALVEQERTGRIATVRLRTPRAPSRA